MGDFVAACAVTPMLSHRVGAGRRFLTFVITFLSVLLIAPAAFAARVDVGARVVGLIVAGPTTITFGPPTYPGFFNLDVASEVRFDSSTSIFHYYYTCSRTIPEQILLGPSLWRASGCRRAQAWIGAS